MYNFSHSSTEAGKDVMNQSTNSKKFSFKCFLGWHKVMESIDSALELGYDPVKVGLRLNIMWQK